MKFFALRCDKMRLGILDSDPIDFFIILILTWNFFVSARAIHFDFSGSVPEQFLLAPASLFQRWKPAKTKHEQAQKKTQRKNQSKKKRRDTHSAPISDPGGFLRLDLLLSIFFDPAAGILQEPGINFGTEGVEPSWVIFSEPGILSPRPETEKYTLKLKNEG